MGEEIYQKALEYAKKKHEGQFRKRSMQKKRLENRFLRRQKNFRLRSLVKTKVWMRSGQT